MILVMENNLVLTVESTTDKYVTVSIDNRRQIGRNIEDLYLKIIPESDNLDGMIIGDTAENLNGKSKSVRIIDILDQRSIEAGDEREPGHLYIHIKNSSTGRAELYMGDPTGSGFQHSNIGSSKIDAVNY